MACLVLVSYHAKPKIELVFAFLEGDLGFTAGCPDSPAGSHLANLTLLINR